MGVDGHYEFGSNWRSFIQHHLTEERIEEAKSSLVDFMGPGALEGRSFLDIGCGSGLFSLAAIRLGAARVTSIDIDPDSVACCGELREREGAPPGWDVREGSVLDEQLLASLGQFDVVYSWGVLHHTGAMWRAIAAAAERVAPGGLLFIAIYNKADGIGIYADGRVGSSRFWELEKRLYNSLPRWARRLVDAGAAGGMVLGYIARGKNPLREIRSHKTLRGMSWIVDIRDWLGGFPYEYASVEEIFRFVHDRFGYALENVTSTNTLRNNEFLFRRREDA